MSPDNLTTILLPGLDGTGLLFNRFLACSPDARGVSVLALPDDPKQDYQSLAETFSGRISMLESCHLVAESFSGPVGILLAHRFPEIIKRLTLVASLATSPVPFAARMLPWTILARFPIPSAIAKRFLVGREDSVIPELNRAIRCTSTQTLARRVRLMASVDVTSRLSELVCEIVYIRPGQDRVIPRRVVDRIVTANPGVIVHEIDGPHLILQARPEEAWKLMDR